MFSNISFGSRFEVANIHNNFGKMLKFAEKCTELQNEKDVYMAYESSCVSDNPELSFKRHLLIVPDSMDLEIETYVQITVSIL